MQRDGNSDDRTKTGASGRTPPVIEGEAVDISARPEHPSHEAPAPGETAPGETAVAELAAVEAAAADAEIHAAEEASLEGPSTNGSGADAIAAPPAKKSRGGLLAVLGILVVAIAGAVAWIAAPGHVPGDGSLKARVIAFLPPAAQRALHVAPAPAADSKSAAPASDASRADSAGATPSSPPAQAAKADEPKPDAVKPETAKSETAGSEAAKPEAAKSEAGKSEAAKSEPVRPEERTAAAEPATPGTGAAAPASDAAAPAPGADPGRIQGLSMKIDAAQAKIDALQGKLDAALGRIDDLQSKLELAQGKIDLSQSKSDAAATADALAQASQRIETLTQKLAAIEQKLEQPKTDARAPQARENNAAPSGREMAASRAVVAQATTEALRAGAPLGDDLAALKGLGVVDEKLADLNAYAKAGAPTLAQLTQQWRGLRDKVIALDAPPPSASFGDKLLARAKGVFHVTWAGQGAQNSITSTVSRVDAALAKSDLAGAVAACGDFPAVAKNVVADWQTAAAARLKADAAARALLSESISAIGRSSSQ